MSQTAGLSVRDLEPHLDEARMVERLTALVRSESENPPGNEAEVAALVAAYAESLGLTVSLHELEPGRPSVVARWVGGQGPVVGYCSHYDVVPAGDRSLWSIDPYGAHVEDGRMHGRGTADAKGPIAAALEAVEMLRESGFTPRGTLELELVADEETMGFKGAGFLVQEGIIAPDFAIVGEPTSLRVVRAQRGACWMRITTRGRAGHGSAPERGVSAIRHMAEIVARLEETMPDISHELLGGTSINVGTIAGGEKVNIIPAHCVIEVDRRTIPGESRASVLATVEAALGLARSRFEDLDATVEIPFHADPFEVPESSLLVQAALRSVGDLPGVEPTVAGFRGASDARFLADQGAETIVMGPGDISLAHTARESVELAEVGRCALAYALTFARLLGAG